MGSRSKIELAYSAGFLDGDGSLMLQIKKRKDGKSRIRFMTTICFYQDSRHEEGLGWIRKVLGIGYLSKRKDGMSELRINGYSQVRDILEKLMPSIRFKKQQAVALHKAATLLSTTKFRMLSEKQLKELVDYVVMIQNHDYATKKKRTREELLSVLDLTP